MINVEPNAIFARLLMAYAPPQERVWQGLVWALDERLAGVVRTVREPAIAAIRLAWWRDALVHADQSKGRGEPLIEAWRTHEHNADIPSLVDHLIDGWTVLLETEELTMSALHAYAEARGSALFSLLAAKASDGAPSVELMGALWTMWDLAGHLSDDAAAQSVIDEARRIADRERTVLSGRTAKPLRLACKVALDDIKRSRVPKGGFRPRHYVRLVRHAMFG